MATLQQQLDSIISSAVASTMEKTAGDTSNEALTESLTDSDAIGLSKIASVLRSTSIEPTYKDLYNFIGGLYGH